MKKARPLHPLKPRAVHESFGRRRVRHRQDHEVGAGQERVERIGRMQLGHAGRHVAAPAVDADHAHAERRATRAVSAPMPPTPTISAVDSARWMTPVSSGRLCHSRRSWLRQVVVEPAREGEHEGHDVRGDVIVEDLAEIGDRDRVRDELGVVVAGGRRGLRRLEPAEPRRVLRSAAGMVPNAASAWPMARAACSDVLGDDDRRARGPPRRAAWPIRGSFRSAAAASRVWSSWADTTAEPVEGQ